MTLEPVTPAPDVAERCGEIAEYCICARRPHPREEPHACFCGGAWQIDADGEFVIVRVPHAVARGAVTISPSATAALSRLGLL